jgi:hypothetical protein
LITIASSSAMADPMLASRIAGRLAVSPGAGAAHCTMLEWR